MANTCNPNRQHWDLSAQIIRHAMQEPFLMYKAISYDTAGPVMLTYIGRGTNTQCN